MGQHKNWFWKKLIVKTQGLSVLKVRGRHCCTTVLSTHYYKIQLFSYFVDKLSISLIIIICLTILMLFVLKVYAAMLQSVYC